MVFAATAVSGMMEYHAVVFLAAKAGRSVLFIQPDAVPDIPPNQQEPTPREGVGAIGVNSQFQVGTYLVADFDRMYFVGEVVRQETDGTVQVKYLRTIGGKLNRYNWPAIEDMDDAEEIFLPRIPALQATGGRNRIQYVLQEVLSEKIITAHHKFLNS